MNFRSFPTTMARSQHLPCLNLITSWFDPYFCCNALSFSSADHESLKHIGAKAAGIKLVAFLAVFCSSAFVLGYMAIYTPTVRCKDQHHFHYATRGIVKIP